MSKTIYNLAIFIEKGVKIHGDDYDYSQITEKDIKSSRSKVKIKCNKCNNEFIKIIYAHINGKQGCPECIKKTMWNAPWTLERFKERGKIIHNDKFDYSLITEQDVKSSGSHVQIICKTCENIWSPSIEGHIIRKYGCPGCSGKNPWTLERFLKQSNIIHGDNYDYSQITEQHIKGVRCHIPIKCNNCNNEWSPTISAHINDKSGCPNCNTRGPTYNLSFFLEKGQTIHGDKYDYSQITEDHIKGVMSSIPLTCKTCEYSWNTTVNIHINGKYGCPSCSEKAPWTLDKFLKQSNTIDDNNYDYSKVSEEHFNNGVMSNIPVKCNICNYEWNPTINNHINGKCGCPNCNKRAPYTLERFKEKAIEIHGNNYDYSLIIEQDIKSSDSKLPIKCNICQYKWNPTINSHIIGKCGCPNCNKNAPYTLELFLEKAKDIHGNNFDYHQITEEHINGGKSVIPIKCNSCLLTWYPSIKGHINAKSGCPNCKNKTELKLFKELTQFYSNIIREFKSEWCVNIKTNCPLPFDFCLTDFFIIIELDGAQHFRQISNWVLPEITQKRDIYKQNCANKNRYSVIRILQEDVWYDKYNWLETLIEMINYIINIKQIVSVYLYKNDEYTEFIKKVSEENGFITEKL